MNPDLNEKDFIHEGYSKDPFPFWLWIAIPAILAALLWGGRSWYLDWREEKVEASPFLQVTNREFSQFLWQNPEYMRANSTNAKVGYLPAFQYSGGAELDPTLAEKYVVAPPEILFLYHTWSRQLGDTFIVRPMLVSEFQEFLHAVPEWQPRYWSGGTTDYQKLVLDFSGYQPSDDLALLSVTKLPQSVRRAFQGWKNFYKEGEEINQVKPTYEEMQVFLQKYPTYDRPRWRNIVVTQKGSNEYLKDMNDKASSKEVIPNEELASFLKVGFFNFKKANEKAEISKNITTETQRSQRNTEKDK